MEIKEIEISKLKFADYNPRLITDKEFNGLKKSLETFGFVDPVIVNRDMTIVGGHMRTKAWSALGNKTAPCHVVDLNKKQERKLNILLNSSKISGKYDELKLAEMLQEFKVDNDYELLNLDELEPLNMVTEESNVQEDDFQEPKVAKYDVKVGDVFKLGEHRLMCGDSTSIEVVEKLMDGNKADMVFTDPPYGIDLRFGTGNGNGIASKSRYKQILNDRTTGAARDVFNYLQPLGIPMIYWGANYFTDFLPPSRCWISWYKRDDLPRDDFCDTELAYTNIDKHSKTISVKWKGMIKEGEMGQTRVHPNQKPVELVSQVFRYTDAGLNILDLFGGSGSTLIACEQLKRKCYMMELDPFYCSVIIERWEKLTSKAHEKL